MALGGMVLGGALFGASADRSDGAVCADSDGNDTDRYGEGH